MRLTLRTLLAYLDDVLDPADKEDLARKIESSEFAEDLVHRTRDVMRRLRLSAPQVVGVGMALDPNTVSEYLDNVLPPEQVGDFERICLESDVHLAEAAACHHVLTMVLGEPADVDPKTRQRMYGIAAETRERKRHRVEPAHTPGVTSAVVSATLPASAVPVPSHASASSPPAQRDGSPEIPEYLRAGSWWKSSAALLGLAVVLLLAATVYFAFGWFGGPRRDVAQAPDAARVAEAQPAIDVEQPVAPVEAVEPPVTAPEEEAQPPDLVQPVPDPVVEAPVDVAVPEDVAPPEEPSEAEIEPALIEPAVVETVDIEPATDAPAVALLPRDPAAAIAPGEPIEAAPAPDAAEAPEAESTVEEEVPAITELGTFLGAKAVLLRWDDEERGWFRVLPREAVSVGERLLALPEFRPKVTLAAGIHMELIGGTQVVLGRGEDVEAAWLSTAEADAPVIELDYGRLVLLNTSMGENRVRLAIGPTMGEARLARNATLAIEVTRQFVPGADPRQTPSPVVARFYAPDGGVVWQDEAGEKPVDRGGQWAIADGATSDVVADAPAPEWIDGEPAVPRTEQRYGAPRIEGMLVADRPAEIQLLEIFHTDHREVRSLAARSCIHVGQFAPFVDALRDSDQRANWANHIESLRAAMIRSPETAERVYQTLVEQRGKPAAADLYEMLCGYNLDHLGRTPEQIRIGALAQLIDWLENDGLDYRVLAVHVLRETTGKTLMPNPAANINTRARNVRDWRQRLETGQLRPLGV